MKSPALLFLFAPALLPTLASSQEVQRPDPRLGNAPFLTPIRAVAADNGVGGGLWASGEGYKASFADGVTFFPVLGKDAPRNLPLRWRTRSIAVGSLATPLGMAQTRHTDWRFELQRGAVTEAYDVRNDGVEQTFVIAQPLGPGDLTISGEVDSELRAEPTPAKHGEVVFCDAAGKPRVNYGAAVAIDAVGRRVAMQTSFDGQNLSLHLSGAWLADAAYPVVVDPLLAPVNFATGAEYASALDMARDDSANELGVIYRRSSAGTDYDAFARVIADNLAGGSFTIWSDIDASWSTEHCSIAFVGATAKWVLGVHRKFPASNYYSWIRYHLHNSGDHTAATDVVFVAKPAAETWTEPDVGGTPAFTTGNQALMVFKAEDPVARPFYGDVYGMLIDTSTGAYGSTFLVGGSASGTTYDRGGARVNKQSAGGTASWVVAFGEFNRAAASDDWDTAVVKVSTTGAVTSRAYLPNASLDHKLRPVIDGQDGRYMLVYGMAASGHIISWMHTLRAVRVDFAEAATSPTFRNDRLLATGGEFFASDIAYDTWTESHWTVVHYTSGWDTYATRLGFDAGVTEQVALYDGAASSSSPTVCFNDDTGDFTVAYPTTEAGYPVYVRQFEYPVASAVVSGTGCGGSISRLSYNYAGSEFFAPRLSGAGANAPAVLLVAVGSTDVPLDGIGMPGCRLLVNPLLFTLNTAADAAGSASVRLPLASNLAGANLWFQWAHVSLGANAANLLATPRLAVQVR